MTRKANSEDPEPERNETPAERLDRNWSELLQELRVTQTGIQILLGFMLALPFQPRFEGLEPSLKAVYLAALACGTMCTACIVAPVTAHRLLFRIHAKDVLVAMGNGLALVGLAFLGVTVALVATLVVGVLVGTTWGWVSGGGVLLVFAVLWVALPLWLRRTAVTQRDYV